MRGKKAKAIRRAVYGKITSWKDLRAKERKEDLSYRNILLNEGKIIRTTYVYLYQTKRRKYLYLKSNLGLS